MNYKFSIISKKILNTVHRDLNILAHKVLEISLVEYINKLRSITS